MSEEQVEVPRFEPTPVFDAVLTDLWDDLSEELTERLTGAEES